MDGINKKVENRDCGSGAGIILSMMFYSSLFHFVSCRLLASGISQVPSLPGHRWLCTQLNLFVQSWSPESKTSHLIACERRNFSVQNLCFCKETCYLTVSLYAEKLLRNITCYMRKHKTPGTLLLRNNLTHTPPAVVRNLPKILFDKIG